MVMGVINEGVIRVELEVGVRGLGGQVVNVQIEEGRSKDGSLGDTGVEFYCFGGCVVSENFLVSIF